MNNPNILVIDDSTADFVYYKHLISKIFDTPPRHANCAEEGVEALKQHYFDLIFLDYNLHDMNGIEFIKQLQEDSRTRNCPIILITGYGNEEVATQALKLGAYDYIAKDKLSLLSLERVCKNALEKFKDELIIKQKQQELYLFAHTISHDLMAPLGRINAYSGLLQKIDDSEKGQKMTKSHIKKIAQDSSYCIEFVKSLFSYAEKGRSNINFQNTCIYKSVKRAIKNLEIQINNSGAEISIEELPTIFGDRVSICQLFQNLISNSIKYCSTTPEIKISALDTPEEVIIHLTDNGIGIDQSKAKEEVFKPFARLDNNLSENGLGLGLSTCKSIVDQHKGTITITSNSSSGTIFTITFPKSA